ncbi:ABC transporter permease [Fulvivirga sp.]|uniref:ABC transporter permease n=1 Tax=Fulvivirga sp. TaxID=1931237 RepID=UPI0032EF1DD7
MIRNYLITALRSLFRNKVNTTINIVGLSMGISCAIVLFLLANYAGSYNKFEANYDHIYRFINSSPGQGGEMDYTPGVPVPFRDAVREDFPEFEHVILTRDHYGETIFTINPSSETPIYNELQDKRIVFTENDYFKMFTVNWLEGNRDKALDNQNGIVLSEKIASIFFPDGNALGQELVFNKIYNLEVTGIVGNPPSNTDMPFDIFISLGVFSDELKEARWNSVSSNDQCYVMLADSDNAANYKGRIADFVGKHFEKEDEEVYELQPMSELHFSENHANYSYNSVSKNQILVMILIGVFLMLTACINFVNLSTAIAIKRSKEVGVRKVMGSTRYQLVLQFLAESFGLILLSVVLALGLAELLIIYINPFLDVVLDIQLFDPKFIALLLGGVLLITVLAGFYPALVLSGFRPALALKGQITSQNSGGMNLRKGLVVFQFFISQVFIIGTIVTLTQLDYMRQADLGFDTEAIVSIRIPEKDATKMKTLSTEVSRLAGVENFSLSFSAPSSGSVSVSNFNLEEEGEDFYTSMKFIDKNYIDLYGMDLLAGRSISESDTLKEVVVNEKLLRYINHEGPYESAIGKQVRIWGRWVPIVGVVKDFNSTSLHDDIMTVAMFSDISSYRMASIKVNLSAFQETNQEIKKLWKAQYPEYEYDYDFYDDRLQEFYEGEEKMATIFSFFSSIAIIVGCMGLFGLSSFMINQRTKEIGVRKTLGATVSSIVGMFSLSFFKLIGIAFVFAAPLAYFGMNEWLQGFQYRIDLNPMLFALGLLGTIIVAAVTVSYKSVKAASANPVDSLRDE